MKSIKKALSIMSAVLLSGMCVLSNMSFASAETSDMEFGLPEAPDVNSQEYQEYLDHYSNGGIPDVPGAGDVTFGSSCDLSKTKYFPAIGNQSLGSCTSWSTTYYQFTYEANKLNNISSNSSSNIYSPVYTFSFIGPVFNYQAYDFLKIHGAVKISEMPLSSSYTKWCTNTDAMVNALNTRVKKDYANRVYTNHASENLDYIKSLLYGTNGTDGKIISVNTTDFEGWEYEPIKNPVTVYTEYAAVRSTRTYDDNEGGDAHALTVVGYNDNIWCDLNGNNKKDNGEVGAFKVANSYGTGYKNSGYVWVMYDALNSQSMVSGWEDTSKTRKPIFEHYSNNYNEFYWIDVENKEVEYVGQLTLNTNNCSSFMLYAGKNTTSVTPSNFNTIFDFDNTKASNYTGTLVFDYADLANPIEDNLTGYRWFVKVVGIHNSRSFKITDNLSKTIVNFNSISNGTHSKSINLSKGDLNYDNSIDSLDVEMLSEYNIETIPFSNVQKCLGDFNNDGIISNADISALSKYLLFNGNLSTYELRKISEINQKNLDYMIANNYSSAEIQEIRSLNFEIKAQLGGNYNETK